jgi:hypothetical protein
MAALRRGIPHYQTGAEDTPAPVATLVSPEQVAQSLSAVRQSPIAASAGPSGAGQLFSGDYSGALNNPESSAATRAYATKMIMDDRATRVRSLQQEPLWTERWMNFFGGNPATDKALADRTAVAQVFKHPLVQQHLMSDPNALAMAEQNRFGYAHELQNNPKFGEHIQAAVGRHAEIQQNPKPIPLERHPQVAETMRAVPGATADQVNASMAPHEYTKEEFRRAMLGAPLQVVHALFPEFSHVITPEEDLTKSYFNALHSDYKSAIGDRVRLEAEDAALKEAGKPQIHSYKPWFGQSHIEAAKELEAKKLKAIKDAIEAKIGITGKAIGAVQDEGGTRG